MSRKARVSWIHEDLVTFLLGHWWMAKHLKNTHDINIEFEEVGHLCWFSSSTEWQGVTQICLYFPSPLEAHGFTSIWQTAPEIWEIRGHLPGQQELRLQLFFPCIPFLLNMSEWNSCSPEVRILKKKNSCYLLQLSIKTGRWLLLCFPSLIPGIAHFPTCYVTACNL